jgi:hypothetical protein
MSETTNLTPPIRSIAAEASSKIPSNDTKSVKLKINSNSTENKSYQRSASSTSLSSTSSSEDSVTFSVHGPEDDEISSTDGISVDWAQLEERLHTLERLSKSI